MKKWLEDASLTSGSCCIVFVRHGTHGFVIIARSLNISCIIMIDGPFFPARFISEVYIFTLTYFSISDVDVVRGAR